MLFPPTLKDSSPETVKLYENEKNFIFNGLKDRAIIAYERFNKMKNITCNRIEGRLLL